MRPIVRSPFNFTTAQKRVSTLCRHVVVDVETTGLSPRHGHRVIEIGAVAVEGGAVVEEFTTLIDAGVPIPPAVQAIHGITDEMLAGQPPPEEVLPRFRNWMISGRSTWNTTSSGSSNWKAMDTASCGSTSSVWRQGKQDRQKSMCSMTC